MVGTEETGLIVLRGNSASGEAGRQPLTPV